MKGETSTGLRSRGYQVRILAAAPRLRVIAGAGASRARPTDDFVDRLRPEAEARAAGRRVKRAVDDVLRMFADPIRRAVRA